MKKYFQIVLLNVSISTIFNTHLTAQKCSDTNATAITKKLYANLFNLKNKYTIFGHQDDLAYGVGWKYENKRSDIHSLVNDYPGLYGWDIAHIELDSANNIDGVPFNLMKQFIKQAYQRGGVITISWHARNPLTENSAWDTTYGSVQSILPGNIHHKKYTIWLDKVAAFLNDLKLQDGTPIPILFRPFHELTGNWFWWCKNASTASDFIKLWHFTIQYLQQKNVHHLLYVYNTADFSSPSDFLNRYPGDDVVDIVSFDRYQFAGKNSREEFIKIMKSQIGILKNVAASKQKIAAIAETGYEAIPDKTWWTKTLLPLIQNNQLSYVLVWRNEGYMPSLNKMHFYAPYPKQISASDFKVFYKDPSLLFQQNLRLKNIYQ
jgi:mannan endo-1,4-beta-mannosidase